LIASVMFMDSVMLHILMRVLLFRDTLSLRRGLSAKLIRALNRTTAQTQVLAEVKPELLRAFNIITVSLVINCMQKRSRMVPAKHPLRPSNSDPAADSKP
jgi:hypothetical protein